MHAKRLHIFPVAGAPYLVENHLRRDHPILVLCQTDENVELRAGKPDLESPPKNPPLSEIHLQIANLNDNRTPRPHTVAAKKRPHPRQQLCRPNGFHHTIIRTTVQGLNNKIFSWVST